MKRCEFFEIEISALADGELPQRQALAAVDHLVSCAQCREFYARVRDVAVALEEAQLETADGDLPAGLWQRIARSAEIAASTPESAVRRLPGVAAWALRAAAVAVLAVGAVLVNRGLTPSVPASPEVLQVELESRRGRMTEDRFLELATELLQADRRYRLQMEEIMTAVNRQSFIPEGSFEGPALRSEEPGELRRAGIGDSADRTTLPALWY